mmetsp:Transcript_15237/g.25319  ORF Transcript_15237/g.25319 Transcript_15237/m.25319 type:complete len:452 (+) Transcript_15237:323-1678(+)
MTSEGSERDISQQSHSSFINVSLSNDCEHVESSDQVDDFFFMDIPLDLPSSSVEDKISGQLKSSSSAPTLRKYSSRDSEKAFAYKGRDLSSKSLNHTLSSPRALRSLHPISSIREVFTTEPSIPTIDVSDLTDMKRVCIGRVSVVYKALYQSAAVAVKIMMPGLEKSKQVQAEFDMEQQLLSTLAHPNIVRLIGCGLVDGPGSRRFTVLEWLDDSLDKVSFSVKPSGVSGVLHNVFASPSSAKSFPRVLPVLKQIGSVLRYLHGEVVPCHLNDTRRTGRLEIVHRAVTPEHFRFNGEPSSGTTPTVKLISFMGCFLTWHPLDNAASVQRVCAVPQLPIPHSLCYTPPEVALRLSHSTESDIYAFALLSWQLTKNKIPFARMNKSKFMSQVIYKGVRPKLSKSWCRQFQCLLDSCWHGDPALRPPMSEVCEKLADVCENYNIKLPLTSVETT